MNESRLIPTWLLRDADRRQQELRAWKQRLLLTERLDGLEILDTTEPDAATLRGLYRELDTLHRWLGNRKAVLRELSGMGVGAQSRVLDIGCGQGALLATIRKRMGCAVVGVDIRGECAAESVTIVRADAARDALPQADVAVCVVMAHHLDPDALEAMICNVARSCDALVLLDLVRHPVPLALFRTFVAPLLSRIHAADGQTSIRRAYTAREMKAIVERATKVSGRPVKMLRHRVAPMWVRQVVMIRWG